MVHNRLSNSLLCHFADLIFEQFSLSNFSMIRVQAFEASLSTPHMLQTDFLPYPLVHLLKLQDNEEQRYCTACLCTVSISQ
jgi:hypothetical protein